VSYRKRTEDEDDDEDDCGTIAREEQLFPAGTWGLPASIERSDYRGVRISPSPILKSFSF
jgi:hypothetical protein